MEFPASTSFQSCYIQENMALKWILSAAFTQVFGHSESGDFHTKPVIDCPDGGIIHGHVKDCEEMDERVATIEMNNEDYSNGFQMPIHYPRYSKLDYEKMEEWKVDMLLKEYGFSSFMASVNEKREFAMGAFLWPHQV